MAAPDLHAQIQAQIKAQVAARKHRSNPAASNGHVSVAELRASHLSGQSIHDTPPAGQRLGLAPPTAPLPVPGTARHRPSPAPARTGTSWARQATRLIILLLLTGVSVIGLRSYVVASYYIPSASMETTLHGCPGCEADMVLVDKLTYRFKSISRTDVVVFNRPPLAPADDKQLIKRVIGLPGDLISGHGGHIYVNNKELIEPYINPACHGTADFAAVTVPAHDYFMMGDNRCDSFDSRMFGPIPRSSIVGRAFAVIWPTKHLRWL